MNMILNREKGSKVSKPIVLLFILMLALIFPEFASAEGQSSGIDTILRSGSLDGDDSYRATIAGYLHKPISWVITIAGFLIITFSFMKVVITLLYLTFPDMFDRIAQFKEQNAGGGFKDKSPIDMISYVFSLILPNIKSLTDYSDDNSGLDVTPLDYLKKKLPLVLFFIIIGAMIYDGKANEFMAKAADIGMFFGNIVEDHDTVGAVQSFVGRAGRYEFTFNTTTQKGKNETKIAESMQNHIHGLAKINNEEYSDIVGKYIEGQMDTIVKDIETAGGKKNIKFEEIVAFNISISSRKEKLSTDPEPGSGLIVVNLSEDITKEIKTGEKYLVIRYSQLRDKYNRNALFEAPDQDKPE